MFAESLPTLVFLHAFPLDREMWRPQIAALGGQANLVALDLPGFGQAPFDDSFTVDSAADDVANSVSGKIVLAGLSMGGYVAMAFARRHADRLSGLILADTRSDPDDGAGKLNRDRLIALTKEFGPSKVYEAMIPKLLCEETRANRRDVVEELKRIAARQTAAGVVGGLRALRDRPDATPELARVVVPTLILVGEHDEVTPPALAEGMARAIPGSNLVVIPQAGHLSNLENPAAFNSAIGEFLKQI
ncbi:MAG TPA: alpha/beta fold hydrolase [Urbifossiella sp.]|jgi:pimeloyl-ACP methyl ester carboxylesterase